MRVYALDYDLSYPRLDHDNSFNLFFDELKPLLRSTSVEKRQWKLAPFKRQPFENFHDSTTRTKAQSRALFERGIADCTSCLDLAFSKRAVDALTSLFGPAGEFLPISVEGDSTSYSVYHCWNLIDALDEKKSTIDRNDLGYVSRIPKHIFHPSVVKANPVFRLSIQPHRTDIFVTDVIAEVVNKAGLTGFHFKEVWPNPAIPPVTKRRSRPMAKKKAKTKKKQK